MNTKTNPGVLSENNSRRKQILAYLELVLEGPHFVSVRHRR
jgi:hypothetical protein